MRRWGLLISTFYAAVVIGLLLPGTYLLAHHRREWNASYLEAFTELGGDWLIIVWVLMLVGGQALLLFVSVDTSWRHRRPRRHIAVSIAVVALAVALLTFAALWSLAAGVLGDGMFNAWYIPSDDTSILGWWLGLWLIWGLVFHAHYRGSSPHLTKVVVWLLRGSILELLIAVPAHVVARQREDCSAPGITAFGIATGLAIMLMCFGPGVFALYRRRLESYRKGEFRRE